MTTEPAPTAPDPIRRDQLPCIPPPEFEFRTVLAARPDGQPGCFLLPGDLGPVVVRRRVTYGDWEPIRPNRWADAPTELATPAASPNETGGERRHSCPSCDQPEVIVLDTETVRGGRRLAAPPPNRDTMREAIRAAIHDADDHSCQYGEGVPYDALATAVLAIRDRDMERLRADKAALQRAVRNLMRTERAETRRADAAEAQIAAALAVAEVIDANGISCAADSIRRALTGKEHTPPATTLPEASPR